MKTPDFGRYRNSELIEYLRTTIEIGQSHVSKSFPIYTKLEKLHLILQEMETVFIQEQGSKLTQDLEKLDLNRDRAITGIRMYLVAMKNHFSEGNVKAANVLLDKMDSYGSKISKMNYQAESTVILNLLEDYQKEAVFQEAIQLLNLSAWFLELKMQNDTFRKKYKERIEEKSREISKSVASLRPDAIERYRKLIQVIEAHHVLTPTEESLQCIQQLEILIREYNTLVNNRSSHEKTEEEN